MKIHLVVNFSSRFLKSLTLFRFKRHVPASKFVTGFVNTSALLLIQVVFFLVVGVNGFPGGVIFRVRRRHVNGPVSGWASGQIDFAERA